MSRALHFVGSLPPEIATDEEAAIRWVLNSAEGLRLTGVPCDADPVWIIDYLTGLEHVRTDRGTPVFEVATPGDFRTYDTMGVYRLALDPTRKGVVELRPEHVSMNRLPRLRSVTELFRKIRAENPAWASLRHQISLPNPLDLALFTLTGPPISPNSRLPRALQALPKLPALLTALKHLPVFAEAARQEVTDLCVTDADDVVFQFETPVVLIMLEIAPRPLRALLARLLARQVADFLLSLPSTAKIMLHLCYGDLGHKSLLSPRDTRPHVLFLNALATRLRTAGRPLPQAHLPLAHGDQAPSTEHNFYLPLIDLDEGYSLIAGLAAHNHPQHSKTALALFEGTTGQRAGIAAACGFGRHTASDAHKAVNLMRTLAIGLTAGGMNKTTATIQIDPTTTQG